MDSTIYTMSLTQEGYEHFCDAVVTYIKSCITDNQGPYFEEWLITEADLDFQHGFESRLARVYRIPLTNRTRDRMSAASRGIVYALQAYISMHEQKDLLEFVDAVLYNQLKEFDTDYVDIVWRE